MKNYANKNLALDYLKTMAIKNPQDIYRYMDIKELIIASQIDIPIYFQKNKTLADLKIPGIGKRTISVLETILTIGPEKIQNQFKKEKEEEIRKQQFQDLRTEEKDKTLPGIRQIIRKDIDNNFDEIYQ